MKERPILFSAPMVRAILDGRKTQTRRIVKGPIEFLGGGGKDGPEWNDPTCWGWADEYGDFHTLMPDGESSCDSGCAIPCPHGRPGDRLWVREKFQIADPDAMTHRDCVFSDSPYASEVKRWASPIHMPRWASRILLQVTAVTVERLQDISEGAALDEGI